MMDLLLLESLAGTNRSLSMILAVQFCVRERERSKISSDCLSRRFKFLEVVKEITDLLFI